MSKKHNYHEVKSDVWKGKALPSDINDPVKEMLLEKLNCKQAVTFVEEHERNTVCGKIEIIDKLNPGKRITMKSSFGMFEGYDLVKQVEDEKWIITSTRHVKNPSLSMKRVKQEDDNAQIS